MESILSSLEKKKHKRFLYSPAFYWPDPTYSTFWLAEKSLQSPKTGNRRMNYMPFVLKWRQILYHKVQGSVVYSWLLSIRPQINLNQFMGCEFQDRIGTIIFFMISLWNVNYGHLSNFWMTTVDCLIEWF